MATLLAVTSWLQGMAKTTGGLQFCHPLLHAMTLHAVTVEDMKGEGEVLFMTSRSYQGRHRLLLLHKESGVVIWDLRYPRTCLCKQVSAGTTTKCVLH